MLGQPIRAMSPAFSDDFRYGKSAFRIGNRWAEQFCERQRAEAFAQGVPSRDNTRNGHGMDARRRHFIETFATQEIGGQS
jgi:hypothetical protein